MKYLALLLILTAPVFADTVIGTGGVSPAVTGFSSTAFEWVDNTGGVNASVLSSVYGYNVFATGGATGAGSLLLSNPFTVNGTSTLDVNISLFTAENVGSSFNELGFVVLLQNSQMVAILAASRPDGINHDGDFGDMPGTTYLGPSAGVTTTLNTHFNLSDLPVITLGSQQYGTLVDGSSCGDNCLTDINSMYTPGAGTYQLLYGSFYMGTGPNPNAAAVAVKSVTVPEPAMPFELAVTGLMLIALFKFAPRSLKALS
jgi:hypothetical protein